MLTIRSMYSSDIDEVYSIELGAHRTPWSREIISDCVLVGYDCRVLEESDDDIKSIVGYMIGRRSLNVYHVLNFCIAPSSQNRGLGKFMLKEVLDSLTTDKLDTIILEVRPTNKVAIALYEAFGFQQDAIKKDYYKDKNGVEDALLLKKTILRTPS
ncbi:MAG: ribosomal protein S18-alanine N-acetyltransferase [Legionella sp.]|nr:ribosomal protein S18-alanine N-acetyltransferase [Legionella sp.]